jgi:lysophospholipase
MIRRRALLALLLALAGCEPRGERDPFTDSRVPPGLGPAFWPPQGWTWGLIQVGKTPPQRYGVAAPPDEGPVAQVLIMPGYGEVAEEEFAAANALIERRVQVWTLDGVGQGGSGRITGPRDLGHVDSFASDIEGVRRMVAEVIRSTPDAPLVIVADGTAAPVLLRAADQGLPGVSALVLTAPRLSHARPAPITGWSRWLGLERHRAPGGSGWRRDQPRAAPDSTAFARLAWQAANPDLRMGGPSLGWLAAFADLSAAVRARTLGKAAPPVLILVDPAEPAADRADASRLCQGLPHCDLKITTAEHWPEAESAFIAAATHARLGKAKAGALSNPDLER